VSAAKHTPGPWTVFDQYADTEIRSPSGCIAALAPWGLHGRDAVRANARLIAAAPELLSLLEDAVASFADSVEGGEADGWVMACRAAIAKATGSTE
jgi:hypothetical protein